MKHDWSITPIPGMTIKNYTCRKCKITVKGVSENEVNRNFGDCLKNEQLLIIDTNHSIQLPCRIITSISIAESFQKLRFPVFTVRKTIKGQFLHHGITLKDRKYFVVLPKHDITEQNFYVEEE